jgi:hypothetical protein
VAEPVTKIPNEEGLLDGTTTKPDASPVLEVVKDVEVVADGSLANEVVTGDAVVDVQPALVVMPT